MSELKPCPFCGGEAEEGWGDNGEGFGEYYIGCSNDQCEIDPSITYDNKKSATEAWNTRDSKSD